MDTKLIFITGGVVSSIGKGITAAALGRLLKARGYKASIMKFDPYLNVDPGIMNPYQHGEVFVTGDGAETDLDVGHYERFINQNLTKLNYGTTGQIYSTVIDRERHGGYKGETVQVIPHITDEIKRRIILAAEELKLDFLIVEIGGTVGDIESQPFLEAIRQLKRELKANQCCFIHVTLIPYLRASGELKTKPTQHSVKELQSIGIQPDVIVCRSERPLNDSIRSKIALFCNVPKDAVIENLNADSLYQVPLMLEETGFCSSVLDCLGMEQRKPDFAEWEKIVEADLAPKRRCTVALVGNYIELHDAYLSVVEALNHSGIANSARVKIKWVASGDLEKEGPESLLNDVDGIIAPGGFCKEGLEGIISAARYARENKIPYFGICLGLQAAVIEFARDVLGWKDAHCDEVSLNTEHPVIAHIAGPQRRGGCACKIKEGSRAYEMYGTDEISERHHHSYEFNNKFAGEFCKAGFEITGHNPQQKLVDIMEIKEHPWFVCVQFHPEFTSRPLKANPLFRGFIKAVLDTQNKN